MDSLFFVSKNLLLGFLIQPLLSIVCSNTVASTQILVGWHLKEYRFQFRCQKCLVDDVDGQFVLFIDGLYTVVRRMYAQQQF